MTEIEQPIDCDNESLMDSRAAFSSGCDEKIICNVAKAEVAMQMTANAGGSVLDEHDEMLGLKHNMWVNEDGMETTASPEDFSDQHHVHFDGAEEDAFIVCDWDDVKGKNAVRFPWNCILNFCSHKFPKAHPEQPHDKVDKKMQSVNAVAENCSHHSAKQCE